MEFIQPAKKYDSFFIRKMMAKFAIITLMNRKQKKILASIFAVPTPASIKFSDIEKLLISLGAEKIEGSCSRWSFELNDQQVFVHRPHPVKEAKKYQVEVFREFLKLAGVKNE